MRRRVGRMPAPLLAILASVAVMAVAWTFAVPALQGADEAGHVAYVQRIADAGEIPWTDGHVLPSSYGFSVSREQRIAWTWAGLEPLRGNLAARPLWSRVDEDVWERRASTLTPADRRDGLPNASYKNPPLYYLVAAGPYELAGGSFFDRFWAMRLMSLPLLLLVVVLTWLIAGEVFGRRRLLQSVAAAVVGMQPVLLDVGTRVTPDVLLNALGAAVLYLLVLLVRRGPRPLLLLALAGALVAVSFTHGRGIGLVPPATAVAAWVVMRRLGLSGRLSRVALGVGAAASLAGLAIYASRASLDRAIGFASYLWQFYLPALPGMDAPRGTAWDAGDVFVDRLFATFVQFEVRLPGDLQSALRLVLVIGLIGVAAAVWRQRRQLRRAGAPALALLAVAVFQVLALHAAAFRSLIINPADPVITGRYLLVLAPMIGIATAAALTALSSRARSVASAAVVTGAFLLQLSAFGLVVERFYA